MLQIENKCQNLEVHIKRFHKKFYIIHKKGLPSLRNSRGQLIQQEGYQNKLHDITINNSQFSKLKGNIGGRSFLQGFENGLFISYEIHHLFVTKSIFEKYTKVDETYMKLINFSYPYDDKWDNFHELSSKQKAGVKAGFGQRNKSRINIIRFNGNSWKLIPQIVC